MLRLASVVYSIIATTLAGSFVIVALVGGYDTLMPIVVAAGLGAMAALPVAWLVARALMGAGATE